MQKESSRRDFVKTAAYVVPVVLSIKAAPAFARSGSGSANGGGGNGGPPPPPGGDPPAASERTGAGGRSRRRGN